MAFRIANKEPIDSSENVGVGVSLPFSGPAVFNSTYQTGDQIKSNIRNYFLSSKGERFLNPNYGSTIKRTIFESITNGTLDSLQQTISDDMAKYFPTVKVVDLQVYGKEDSNEVKVELTYRTVNSSTPQTLNILL